MGAGLVYDENMHFYWLDAAPANPAAPTVAELAAGDDLTAYVPKDGISPGITNNKVDGGDLSTKFSADGMGTWKSALAVTFKRRIAGSNAELPWTNFNDNGVTGAVVIVPFGTSAAGRAAYVWPSVENGAPGLMASAENEEQKFQVEFAVRQEPNFAAVIA